ncbi:hypothetical protein [Thiorhodovibrio frisius]|uniref:Restriction endonuclease n=1 Tax=Thiorhodovibrio frisius TaxID=631362 RepID=H8Z8G0_9GAMM|nr:hypothetical protein [Thiorhodovibrio frisius]EIC19365.1 hypothetical protein Thi970DRAFT_04882 [Thiorhodovibrio frisius]WPL22336.1 hypothetical protein Thiofri_02496 [Thiorhodovibrio frisius]
MTHSIEIFLAAAAGVANGITMTPRSANDKEYFPQDWFADHVSKLRLPFRAQGRNSYPDFWVGDDQATPIEGYEIKSLAFAKGRPARRDYDSNSTIPAGRKNGREVFLVFFLYTGSGANPRPIHSLSIAHADLINMDHETAAAHVNEGIDGFGSYGDGFIRDRKMYRFPHPYSIDPSGLGRCRLIIPSDWGISHPSLRPCGHISRTIAANALRSYTVHLDGKTPATKQQDRRPDARQRREFSVFEAG